MIRNILFCNLLKVYSKGSTYGRGLKTRITTDVFACSDFRISYRYGYNYAVCLSQSLSHSVTQPYSASRKETCVLTANHNPLDA